ncbi:30S ribosomal protein S3 [bacterium]|jgi:small subunit ribosomal protein S3|nr:30S ribosomal protein S3 [bacterium]
MGQKANPIVLRLGITRDYDSAWFADKNYSVLLMEDMKIRKFLEERLKKAGISKIKIRRKSDIVDADVYTARPGLIIGKEGAEIAKLQAESNKIIGKTLRINVIEEKNIERNAQLVANAVAAQLEKRMSFRRVIKLNVQKMMRAGAKGAYVRCAGRLGGTEIARSESYREGKIPRSTFRADIDYAFAIASTTHGVIGVTVMVYTGDVVKPKKEEVVTV